MLQCIVNITLTQVTPYTDTNRTVMPRTETFNIDFCHSYEVYSSWNSLSDTATIELPKNVYVTDSHDSSIIWGESTTPDKVRGYVSAGGFSSPQVKKAPLFLRGDKITITAGYSYISGINTDGSLTYATVTNPIFTGFISSIESKSNLKLHCEDNMWMLKQTTMQNKTYYAPVSDISDVMDDIVAKVNNAFPTAHISDDAFQFDLNLNGFKTGNETAADVLNRMRKILPSLAFYFRGNVLRGGGIVYYPQDQNSIGTGSDGKPLYNTFNFQKNIISDALHYSLQGDVKVAAICYSVNSATNQNNTKNKMGGLQFLTGRFQVTVGVPGTANPNDYEYYNFYFKDVSDEGQLSAQGQTYLNRYQYDGFRGSFETFGLPFVEHGNIISITDNLLPERNGSYMVKGVHYTYSVSSGMRQEIELHFKTDGLSDAQLEQGM